MSSSTIPYCAVEERRRLNRCMENASDDYEKEIYRKIRDMPVPYEKLDEILKNSRDIIISMHIPQELRIRSRGTERHSASN